ncbi:MAG TPA: hypothetical protein VGM53_34565 [Streptosporangiaceae bacterium]|jgi:hypothetical protein
MDPFSALIFSMIVATVIMRAAGQAGADQARTELRRARAAIRRDLRARRSAAARRIMTRLEAGRASGPVYPMWWAWAAVRSAGALRRAARQRRRPAEAGRRPPGRTTGPAGRILGAAWRGGAYAWRDMRDQWRTRQQQARERPQPLQVGICERCGAAAAVTALAEAPTRYGSRARMCAGCRAEVAAERRADSEADAQRRARAEQQPEDLTRSLEEAKEEARREASGQGGLPDDDWRAWWPDVAAAALPAAPAPPVASCVRCGEPLGAMHCLNRDCPLCPEHRGALEDGTGEWPQQWRLPVRCCPDCRGQLMPGTWWAVNATNADVCLFCATGTRAIYPDGACRARQPAEIAAASTPIDDQGREIEAAPEGWRQLGAEAARIALAAMPSHDSPPGSPAGPQAPPAPQAAPAPSAPTRKDNQMTCDGEIHTQADWGNQSGAIQEQLTTITDSAENMLRCLNAREAGREHMTLAAQWGDQVRACVDFGQTVIDGVNTRQDPYVGAVQAAGGSPEVAQPGYYDEM